MPHPGLRGDVRKIRMCSGGGCSGTGVGGGTRQRDLAQQEFIALNQDAGMLPWQQLQRDAAVTCDAYAKACHYGRRGGLHLSRNERVYRRVRTLPPPGRAAARDAALQGLRQRIVAIKTAYAVWDLHGIVGQQRPVRHHLRTLRASLLCDWEQTRGAAPTTFPAWALPPLPKEFVPGDTGATHHRV